MAKFQGVRSGSIRLAALTAAAAGLLFVSAPATFAQGTDSTQETASAGGPQLILNDTRDQAIIDATRDRIRTLMSNNPVGGDALAAGIATLVSEAPTNVIEVLQALPNASDPQRRAIARALGAVIEDLQGSAVDADVQTAQLLTATIAQAILCINGSATGVACEGLGSESVAFSDAFNAIQSGNATAAIGSQGALPGPIGFTPLTSGPLGTDGQPLNGPPQATFDTAFNNLLSSGNNANFSTSSTTSSTTSTTTTNTDLTIIIVVVPASPTTL